MNLKTSAASTLLFLAAASSVTAQAANGRYQIGACTTHPLETVVRLENNVLSYWESTCTLANPVEVQGTDGYSYVGNCTGEGQQWQANIFLIPLQGGQALRIINDGNVIDYTRCTP